MTALIVSCVATRFGIYITFRTNLWHNLFSCANSSRVVADGNVCREREYSAPFNLYTKQQSSIIKIRQIITNLLHFCGLA